jgi:uncharacterized membrane protein
VPETLGFDLVHFLYVLSLAVLVGGGFALGSAAAPALFKELERPQAGTVFGAILERWDAAAILAAIMLLITTGARAVAFEDAPAARSAAVAVVLVATLYASAWANPIARQLRHQTRDFDELPSSSAERREFARYHVRSTRATSLAILAGLVALWLS